ncbi:1-deoxy-D-xylulose-5-phosphate reductoisomerase [Rhodovulum sp. YNF3179]|uniref:1-deoxy-D-xylulose-5-phosphate reductoisomerase n=1 Tax=Rhodovulum sp. YNF3179 TaxID=3425127 RepID=UPI003D3285EC
MRRISIFGATGSIGENTIDLVRRQGGPEAFRTVALTGGRNVTRLAELARELDADIAVTAYPECLGALREALAGSRTEAAAGPEALAEAADRPVDWTMSAIVGAAGLVPGLRSLRHGGTLALANKESLVCAGALMMAEAVRHGARILPVDSEHSAIFQALQGEDRARAERVIITASGGPFRDWTAAQLAAATPEQAAAHPNWVMGQRISIDSASLFNKALEMIEAREFFGFAPEQIEVLVHPQSIVHALVGFADGGLMAHLGPADMRHAIGYALSWPDRAALPVERLDLARIGQLEFRAPDEMRFPAVRLAREVMARGGLAGAAFNAAKEAALDAFLAAEIRFPDMAGCVEAVLGQLDAAGNLTSATIDLDKVQAVDHLARLKTAEAARKTGKN